MKGSINTSYSGRKFKLSNRTITLELYHNKIYVIGKLVKKELLSMESEYMYNILDVEGKVVAKRSALNIQNNFKNGKYVLTW